MDGTLKDLGPSATLAGAPRSTPTAAQHPVFARLWARMSGKVGSEQIRTELLAGLRGRVVEVGAGDGRNFAHYPEDVSEVLAIEPESYLRRLASAAAQTAPVPVTVLDGVAESLPVEDGGVEGAITSLVLCSVHDQKQALAELHRALAPGGELRFYEHVVARGRFGRALQAALDGSGVWPHLGAGCHLSRDTVAAIASSGFEVEQIRRFPSGPGSLGVPFVLGTARRV
jgi:SAM-dependent methyltransferase